MGFAPLLLVIAQILFFRRCFTPVRFLVLSKLVADGLEMFVVMMLLVASQLIFEDWIAPKYRPAVGYLALALQYSSFYSSIAMTVNRLLAVSYPLRYNSWFNNRTTIIMVVVCWLFAWIHNLIYLKPECSFTFDPVIEQFVFSTEQCGETLSLYQDLAYNVVLAVLSTAVDIFSLARLRSMSKRTIHIPGGSKREKPWFLQVHSLL
ncbi:hypothetical protein ANCCAN_23138 [Ancylostoma caninum]|uniref:G-protein coupled receptors family 1 profile domain-containing protein n=1 Tax=Ancylostoma caninum TaxID=29170 RepID=A0A368FFX2_ANCCA|nr:hypothetical protein ANCCAN_23138 [Ancylostoma caninum]